MVAIKKLEAESRFHSQNDWLESYHVFNFSHHYRNGRNGFGDLLVLNDDYVAKNNGFSMHPHRDMEIVTWVLSGTLTHEDNQGNKGNITPGEIQQMSAGSGVLHSEINPTDETCHLLQMWVLPDKKSVTPRYQQENVESLINNKLGIVASGEFDAPIHLYNDKATLYVGRFDSDTKIVLPVNEKLFVYIAKGSLSVNSEFCGKGDSIYIDDATHELEASVSCDSEIVIWSIDSHVREQSNLNN